MLSIAFDTAVDRLSVAVEVDGEPPRRVEYSADLGLKHAETLLPVLERLLDDVGATARDLEMVACMQGPGSFTGLRIGYATAKGLCAASGAAFVTVPTLEAMASCYAHYPGLIVCALDARKRRTYAAIFSAKLERAESGPDSGQAREAPHSATSEASGAAPLRLTDDLDIGPSQLAAEIRTARERFPAARSVPVLLIGSGAAQVKEALADADLPVTVLSDPYPTARVLLELARTRFRRGLTEPDHAGPEYIRKSDAELSQG